MVTIMTGVTWYLNVVLNYIPLIIRNIKHLFISLLDIFMSSLEKCLCRSSAHFLNFYLFIFDCTLSSLLCVGFSLALVSGGLLSSCSIQFSSVQLLSRVQLFVTPWTTPYQASLSTTNTQSPPKPTSTELVMPSNHLILCRPLLLPALNLSQHQGLFQWVSSSHQVAKVLEFQLQHQSFQWTPRTDLL